MPKFALLLVDHGSTRQEANDMLYKTADKVKEILPGTPVHIAHMELAEPNIPQGFERCVKDGAEEVIIFPYMLSPGRHATSDIPRLAAEAAQKHPGVKFRVTEPFGVDRKIAELILLRAGIEQESRV